MSLSSGNFKLNEKRSYGSHYKNIFLNQINVLGTEQQEKIQDFYSPYSKLKTFYNNNYNEYENENNNKPRPLQKFNSLKTMPLHLYTNTNQYLQQNPMKLKKKLEKLNTLSTTKNFTQKDQSLLKQFTEYQLILNSMETYTSNIQKVYQIKITIINSLQTLRSINENIIMTNVLEQKDDEIQKINKKFKINLDQENSFSPQLTQDSPLNPNQASNIQKSSTNQNKNILYLYFEIFQHQLTEQDQQSKPDKYNYEKIGWSLHLLKDSTGQVQAGQYFIPIYSSIYQPIEITQQKIVERLDIYLYITINKLQQSLFKVLPNNKSPKNSQQQKVQKIHIKNKQQSQQYEQILQKYSKTLPLQQENISTNNKFNNSNHQNSNVNSKNNTSQNFFILENQMPKQKSSIYNNHNNQDLAKHKQLTNDINLSLDEFKFDKSFIETTTTNLTSKSKQLKSNYFPVQQHFPHFQEAQKQIKTLTIRSLNIQKNSSHHKNQNFQKFNEYNANQAQLKTNKHETFHYPQNNQQQQQKQQQQQINAIKLQLYKEMQIQIFNVILQNSENEELVLVFEIYRKNKQYEPLFYENKSKQILYYQQNLSKQKSYIKNIKFQFSQEFLKYSKEEKQEFFIVFSIYLNLQAHTRDELLGWSYLPLFQNNGEINNGFFCLQFFNPPVPKPFQTQGVKLKMLEMHLAFELKETKIQQLSNQQSPKQSEQGQKKYQYEIFEKEIDNYLKQKYKKNQYDLIQQQELEMEHQAQINSNLRMQNQQNDD